ncbi:MAG: hypothetical protein JXB88_25345 [Spirochaetales bacterium]|nr:hypothetical protein [Spirochaetales bacterium]
MKKMFVCIIILLASMSFVNGCLPLTGRDNRQSPVNSTSGRSLNGQLAESIPSYGYALLPADNKGGAAC